MTDLGLPLQAGVFLTPTVREPREVLDRARQAEAAGLDLVTIQDHPYVAGQLDMWTLLSVIGGQTTRIRLAPNVASLPLRPPVVLAKSAATLDVLTAGRVELGLGTGAFWDGIVAAGGPRREPKAAVDALIEAIGILRQFWSGGTVAMIGDHYQIRGLKAGPVPTRPIPIWLGAYRPRMLRVTGELADGWVPSMGYADPPALPELIARLDDAALAAGRNPADIRRIYNIFGSFGTAPGFLRGTAEDWSEQLAELALTCGMDTFLLGSDDSAAIDIFAAEVVPRLRERVAAER